MAHRTAEDVSGQPDRPLERDLPSPGAGRDLRGRLAELPSAHPSAADHGTDRRPPSEGSPARREALATGALERIGPDVVTNAPAGSSSENVDWRTSLPVKVAASSPFTCIANSKLQRRS
jgi:hypothetical protein